MKMLLAFVALLFTAPVAAQTGGFGGNGRVVGAPNLFTAQVAVGTTAVQVAEQRPTRQKVTVSINSAANCAIGPNATVTLATGFRLQPVAGANMPIDTTAAVFMICDAAIIVSVLGAY